MQGRERKKGYSTLTSIISLVKGECGGISNGCSCALATIEVALFADAVLLPSKKGQEQVPANSEGMLTDRKAVKSVQGIMASVARPLFP